MLLLFDCERFAALRDHHPPNTRRVSPSTRRAARDDAQGSVRRFMESDPHTVLHFISGCMDILDSDTLTHTHIVHEEHCPVLKAISLAG